jgi:hypothetical protein
MGTRNLVMVQLDGKLVISQYGQWDGMPEGQGAGVVEFLHGLSKEKMEQFKANLRTVRPITEEELKQYWKDAGADDSGFVNMRVSSKFQDMHPQLSRNCGSDILKYVLTNKNLPVSLDETFMYDSLFCEWAYLVDLDNNVLEVYEGFNETPLEKGVDRFYTEDTSLLSSNDNYQPIALIITFPLDNLPAVDDFVEQTKKASRSYDEEDEE